MRLNYLSKKKIEGCLNCNGIRLSKYLSDLFRLLAILRNQSGKILILWVQNISEKRHKTNISKVKESNDIV
jgi:hypothetical protein